MTKPSNPFKDLGPNFMTPEVIEYGWLVDLTYAYELSTGTFLSGRLWGVSVRTRAGNRIQGPTDYCQSFGSIDSAREYIAWLKEELRLKQDFGPKEGASHGS